MEEDIKISIIIPIYNCAKYLNECIESVMSQTYIPYEIILIDDGSNDDSAKICQKIVEENNSFKYFYIDNNGVSNSRNYGIEKATGDYICFVDSDDILNKDYLCDFVYYIKKENSDLVCCNYHVIKNSKISFNKPNKNIFFYDKYEICFSKYGGYVWNKIYKRSIITQHNIYFNSNISMCEDLVFNFDYLKHINNISYMKKANYYYRENTNSLSKKNSNKNWFSIFEAYQYLLNMHKEYDKRLLHKIVYYYYRYLIEGKYRVKFIEDINFSQKMYAKIKRNIHEIKKFEKKIPYVFRIKLFVYKIFPILTLK